MGWEHKPNFGSAFINKEKKEDWHAAYRGDVMLPDGTVHYLDLNPATTKAGEQYFKIKIGKVKSIGAPPLSTHNQAKGNGYQPQADEDIPF
jgi:hypothetical protein